MSKRHYLMILIIILVSSGALTYGRSANKENVVSLKIDGSKKFQKVNRVVVNAYTSSWNGEELKPAINLLIDPMHTSIWSMIVETVYNCKYRNDNNNPFVFNLKYDNKRYETLKFKKDRDSTIYVKPEPKDWYTGDIHVHLNCGDGTTILPENKLAEMMKPNNLDVISVLADMGNGEVKDSKRDLPKVNGKDAPQSVPGRIIHWDTEWHWDATYSNFSNQALGGHLVLLGLNNAHQIWAESPYKILEWGRKQNAVTGFAHLEYMNDSVKNELNCCIPIDYPVEAALGTIDFVSEDVYGKTSPNNGNYFSEGAINAYYKLLNCGFRLGLAAGTDYPCNENEPLGTLLTYVRVADKLT